MEYLFQVFIALLNISIGNCKGLDIPNKVFNTEKWSEDIFEKGGQCQFCHVVLSDLLSSKIPAPQIGEQMWLDYVTNKKSKQLACNK